MAESNIRVLNRYPEQTTRGSLLEGNRYTSHEFAEREWENMWTRVWLILGRESEIPNPGDWQMEPVGPEEILMVRQAELNIDSISACRLAASLIVARTDSSVGCAGFALTARVRLSIASSTRRSRAAVVARSEKKAARSSSPRRADSFAGLRRSTS